MKVMLLGALLAAAAAAALALAGERDYRARASVIQVPSDLGGERGIELARTDGVLRQAIALANVEGIEPDWLSDHSRAEVSSRLDLGFTVEAPDPETAAALATGYAKAFRRAIPDDRGLPVRGRGARKAQREGGPVGWALAGGLAALAIGAAVAVIRDGLSHGSAPAPRPASRASE